MSYDVYACRYLNLYRRGLVDYSILWYDLQGICWYEPSGYGDTPISSHKHRGPLTKIFEKRINFFFWKLRSFLSFEGSREIGFGLYIFHICKFRKLLHNYLGKFWYDLQGVLFIWATRLWGYPISSHKRRGPLTKIFEKKRINFFFENWEDSP
jgi:hypothetical protein